MPRYRLTTVSGDKFTVESRDDHAAVVKELLAKGFLFGTREDSTGDAEAILARNVTSVGVVAGTQLFALPEFRFEPPARKSAATPPRAAKKTTAKAKKKR